MTNEEICALIDFAKPFGLGILLTLIIGFLIAKFYVPSYLTEKGKNLATKEDIAKITKIVEEVRSQFTASIEQQKARHQLTLAALDRRLDAHQEAFTLWRKLVANVYHADIGKTVIECQDWWERNCLYLEPIVREGFVSAYRAANDHNMFVSGKTATEVVIQNWARITAFPDLVFEAMGLPRLSELAKVDLKLEPTVAKQVL